MNKLQSILFILTGVLFCTSFLIKRAENKQIEESENNILWSSTRKLTWDDFQGIPDSTSKYKALTFSKISTLLISYNDDSIVYEIPCKFVINKSWSRDKKSEQLLKHEQLHFDIAELSARKIRSDYLNHKMIDTKKTYKFISETFQKYGNSGLNSLNMSYDSETNHGLIKDKQKEWEAKIAKELKTLNAYSNTRIVIKRVKK